MTKNRFFLTLLIGLLIFGCSAFEKTSENNEQKQPEILVFEDVKKEDTTLVVKDTISTELPKPVIVEEEKIDTVKTSEKQLKYIIQLGAFSTIERADSFIKENQQKIERKMIISFNEQTKFYTVQLIPFNTRESADQIRNSIWQIPVFKDAFIITIEE